MRTLIILTLLITMCLSLNAQFSGQFSTNIQDFIFTTERSYDVVKLSSNNVFSDLIGAPQIPIIKKHYVIPTGAVVTSVQVNSSNRIELSGNFTLLPSQFIDIPDGRQPFPFVMPDTNIYSSSEPYPGKIVEVSSQNCFLGYNLITLCFYPIEFIPVSRKLYLYQLIDFTINYTLTGDTISPPLTISSARKSLSIDLLNDLVENDADLIQISEGILNVPVDNPTVNASLDQFPCNMGIIPDYLIITTKALKASFQEFVDWKNKKGVPVITATLEDDIIGKIEGCDSADKIRNYIKKITNAYGHMMLILLGGDINLIPSRYTSGTDYTDYYYATTGNWNVNGNYLFGDTIDQMPSDMVGRIPVRNVDDVGNYFSKIHNYEHILFNGAPANASFLKRMLVMTGSAGITNTAWRDSTESTINDTTCFPGSLTRYRLYDTAPRDEPLRSATALSNLNKIGADGFNLVFHFDHSGPGTMGSSVVCNGEKLYTWDIDALNNNASGYYIFSLGCQINRLGQNGIAKRFLNNSHGGAVVFIGKTQSFGDSPELFGKFGRVFYKENKVIKNHAGYAFFSALMEYSKDKRSKYNLLGDPELPMWGIWGSASNPPQLSINNPPASIFTGTQTFLFTIGNLTPGLNFRVCVSKDNEVYINKDVTATGATMQFSCTINPKTTGIVDVTLTAKNHKPNVVQFQVFPNPGVNLFVGKLAIADTLNSVNSNFDSIADAGERFDLTMIMSNSGASVSPLITSDSLHIKVINTTFAYVMNNGSVSIPPINPQTPVELNPTYRIQIMPNCTDGYRQFLYLTMPLSPPMPNMVDTFSVVIHAPVLSVYSVRFSETNANSSLSNNGILDPGDTVSMFITIENRGSGRLNNSKGILSLSTSNGYVVIYNPYQQLGEILSGASAENPVPFRFFIKNNWNYSTVYFMYQVQPDNSFGSNWIFGGINLKAPVESIANIGYESTHERIKLHWDPIINVRGYNVYRSSAVTGPFVKVNERIIDGFAFIDDYPLMEKTAYYYKIAAVSKFGIEGQLCTPYEAWTTLRPREGWPVTNIHPVYGTHTQGSPMTEDVNNDYSKEIFLTIGEDVEGRAGALLAFKADGKEYRNYDQNPDFNGGFYQFNKATTSCTPAIADINSDGKKEIIVTTRENNVPPDINDKGRVFTFSAVDTVTANVPLQLWTHNVFSDFRGGVVFPGPENDTALNLALKGNWESDPYILEGTNGIPVTGWPRKTHFFAGHSMPVLADLNKDGTTEFIVGCANNIQDSAGIKVYKKESGLYIWNYDGSSFSQNDTSGLFFKYKSGNNIYYDQMDSPPVVADVILQNGVRKPGIITIAAEYTFTSENLYNGFGHVFILDPATGTCAPGWDYNNTSHCVAVSPSYFTVQLPAVCVGEVNDNPGDGPEIFVAGHHKIYGWKSDGTALTHFPITVNDSLETRFIAPLLADVDGDGTIEIVVASNSDKGGVYAYHISTGLPVLGWPLNIGKIDATPCIDDIDYDGKNEIIAASGPTVHVYNTDGNSGRIIWGKYRLNTYNNPVYYQPCDYTTTPLIINGNSMFGNSTVNSDIIIQPGGKLTVKGALNMPLQARIIVKPGNDTIGGGMLVVDGGTITTTCPGLWKGVEVWGNPQLKQTAVTSSGKLIQGRVTLRRGGAIMNAQIGILASARSGDQEDEDLYGYTGGIISADSAFFVNNRIGVQFDPYGFNSCARFTRTRFMTTAALHDSTPPDCFVRSIGVSPIVFCGSTFINTRADVHYNSRGKGVFSQNSYLYFVPYCRTNTIPCSSESPCIFEKLTRGIYATNAAGSLGIDLSKALFLDNTYGAYFSGFTSVSGLRILSNIFRNGQPCPTDSYGLYLDQCTGYHVEDNEFYQTDSSLKGIGLIVNNSGILPNEIYRNRFHNLRFATLSQNVNRNDDQSYDATGLCYKCNKLVKDDLTEPNLFDFAITYDQPPSEFIGIAKYQGSHLSGSSFAPVGNMFKPYPDYPHYDFYNEGNDIDYYFHSQNLTNFRLQPQPQSIYGTVRTHPVISQFTENSCPSTLNGGGSSGERDILVEAVNQSDSIKDVLSTVVDGGSTELLTFDVQTSTPPEAMQLRNELLTESPYLSDTVLKTSVGKEEVLNNALIRDVLVANPHSAKSEKINEMLSNRTIPMPGYMMEQILAGEDSIGPKELLQARKAWWEQEATKSYTQLIHHYQGDNTETANTDSLNWLFDYRNTPSSYYDKTDWLHATQDYDQMAEVMNTIPALFNLTGSQTATHQAYLDFYDASKSICSDTIYAFSIDSVRGSSLQSVMLSNNDLPGAYARNMLLAARKITYQEPVILPDTGLKVTKKEKFRGVKESDYPKIISVFPNPANDYFIVKIDLSERPVNGVINLYDGNGKMLRSFEVHNQKDQIIIPATNLNSGLYLLELYTNGNKISSAKISVVR